MAAVWRYCHTRVRKANDVGSGIIVVRQVAGHPLNGHRRTPLALRTRMAAS